MRIPKGAANVRHVLPQLQAFHGSRGHAGVCKRQIGTRQCRPQVSLWCGLGRITLHAQEPLHPKAPHPITKTADIPTLKAPSAAQPDLAELAERAPGQAPPGQRCEVV